MTDNLFNSEEQPPIINQGDKDLQSNVGVVDLLSTIKNLDGQPKYKSVEEALKALKFSQDHIITLEAENKQRIEELDNLKRTVENTQSIEQIVQKALTSKAVDSSPVTPQNGKVDEEIVSNLVKKIINENSLQQTYKQNADLVSNSIKQKYGEKSQEIIKAKASELGVSIEDLGALASRSPKMILDLFRLEHTQQSFSPSTTSVNIPMSLEEKQTEIPKPQKSLLVGATTREQVDHFKRVKEAVNNRLGIEN